MAESSAAAAVTAIHAVSLKLPTFLAARPDVWFQQTEAQFNLRNITDSTTQYFYLLTSLDAVVAERMAGDVSLTLAVGKYEYLKSKLMGVYGLTDDQKADRLLDLPGLGDWTPSQLCAYIQGLAVDQNKSFSTYFPAAVTRRCSSAARCTWGRQLTRIGTEGRHHHGCKTCPASD